jgi:hypothetical protein
MRESLMYGSVRGARGNSRPYRDWQFAASAHDRYWHKAAEAKAANLRQLLGEQRKCMDGRPRLPSTRMTHQRHWLCTAAKVLRPVPAPIKVLV